MFSLSVPYIVLVSAVVTSQRAANVFNVVIHHCDCRRNPNTHSFSKRLNVTELLPFVYRGIWFLRSALKMDQLEWGWNSCHSWLYCNILLHTSTRFSSLFFSSVVFLLSSLVISSPLIFSLLRFLFLSLLVSSKCRMLVITLLFEDCVWIALRTVTAAFILYYLTYPFTQLHFNVQRQLCQCIIVTSYVRPVSLRVALIFLCVPS